jgi:hypothetical protein
MSRLLVVLVACLLIGGAAGGERPAGPHIRVEPAEFDFGHALPQQRLRKVFRLQNVGDAELVVGRVRTSCGCTAAELQTTRLAPGASTALKVQLYTPSRPGRVEKLVLVASNDKETPVLEVKIQATVDAPADR